MFAPAGAEILKAVMNCSNSACIFMMKVIYIPGKTGETKLNRSGNVDYITFPAFDDFPELTAVFSTRNGGISTGMFSSMNLGRMEADGKENVTQNYRIFCAAVGIDPENIVIADQEHTDNIKVLSADDRGKGLLRKRDYSAVDGFITTETNVSMTLLIADCVPVYLYDPAGRAAGLVHSGWKGTLAGISAKAIRMMNENYGSKPGNMIAVIAPSICKACYEVSADLYEAFSASYERDDVEAFFEIKDNGKFQLDLWEANKRILLGTGLKEENIHVTDLCTCHNSDWLFSHRASGGRRGNLAAVMMLNS